MDEVQNEEEILLDDFVQTFETVFEHASSKVMKLLDSDVIQSSFDYINDVGETLLNCIGTIRAIKKMASIPTKLYMAKFEQFCRGLSDIPMEKRQKYRRLLGEKRFNEESVFILNTINKIEELEELELLLVLLESRLDESISDETFHRYVIRVDNTLVDDLHYLRDHLKNDNFFLEHVQQESLFSSGWIIYSGMGVVGIDDTRNDANLYRYSDSAKEFCKIVYGVEANDTVRNTPFITTEYE